MNAFAESPFVFFVDGVQPVFATSTPRNVKKIVELSDTGCDAKVSVSTILEDATRYYNSKLEKMRSNGQWRYASREENFGNVPYGERFRGRKQNVMDSEEFYFVPEKNEIDQAHYRQRYPTNEDPNDNIKFRRQKIEDRGFRVSPRVVPETRSRRGNQYDDLHEIQSNTARYEYDVPQFISNIPRNNSSYQSSPIESKMTTNRSQSARYDRPKSNSPIYNKENRYENINNRRRISSMDRDLPENFREASRDLRRDNWQRINDSEDLIDGTLRQNHNFSRYDTGNTFSGKSNENWRHREEAINQNARSETCSPFRTKTRHISKTLYEDVDQLENEFDLNDFGYSKDSRRYVDSDHKESLSDIYSSEKLMDRSVDTDSLLEILAISSSDNCFLNRASESRTIISKQENLRSSFWEFIPLDIEDDRKDETTTENRKPSVSKRPQIKTNISANLKGKIINKKAENDESRVLPNSSNTKLVEDKFLSLTRTNSIATIDETNITSNLPSNIEYDKSVSDSKEIADSSKDANRNESLIGCKRKFGWIDASKGRSKNLDKKRTTTNNISDTMNLVEKTVARLKCKLDKSKVEELSNRLSSTVITEKKIRSAYSRLPVPIGRRLRSKNPVVSRLRSNTKTHVSSKDLNKDTPALQSSENQQNSVRSRTKPKIKPSILKNEIVVGPVDDVEPLTPVETDQQVDKPINRKDGKSKLWRAGLLKDENGSKAQKTTKDQMKEGGKGVDSERKETRRYNLMKRTNNTRNSFKENCFFHVHDAQNICDSYCNKDRSPVAIRSRL